MENYRLSSYTIFVKLEDTMDKYMLVHGYTGAIDIVNENIVSCLKSNALFLPIEDCSFSQKTFDILVKRGYITKKTSEEEIEYVGKIAELFHRKDRVLFKYFLFLVSYDCNFRCPYCYEGEISKKGQDWSKKVFTKSMVDSAYETMLKIEVRKELHHKRIILYGGEPLLEDNKDIVEYIVYKGSALGYTFKAITNGYDLSVFKDILSPSLINSVQITVDGDREQHDKRRKHYKTGKSFDRIIENIGMALEKNIEVSVRVNTDAENYGDLDKLRVMFNSMGYFANPHFSMYSALLMDYEGSIVKNDSSRDKKMKYLGPKEYHDKHENDDFKFECQDYGISYLLYSAVKNNKHLDLNSTFCAAQTGEYIFDPCGAIYPCWEVIGKKEHVLGYYDSKEINWTKACEKWHVYNSGNISNCQQCRYSLICHGGCMGRSINFDNSLNLGYCDDYKYVFEKAANRIYKKLALEKIV